MVNDEALTGLRTEVLNSLVDGTKYVFTNSKWTATTHVKSICLTTLLTDMTAGLLD